ncbi:MAG: prenyltransferase, partial [Dysgonomonas sp.]
YFLHTYLFNFQPWLPAIALGLFTTAVLNINNLRDMDNDRKSKKITLAIKLGEKRTKIYHAALTFGGIICLVLYSIIYKMLWYQCLYMIFFIPFIVILIRIFQIKDNSKLDPFLKYTSIATFFLSISFVLSLNIFL